MRWIRFRFDAGTLGSPGSFPWQAWADSATSRRVTIYDAGGEIVAVIDGVPRHQAIAVGRLLEEASWALREGEAVRGQCNRIARTMSEGRLWQADEHSGGGRWWTRLFKRWTAS